MKSEIKLLVLEDVKDDFNLIERVLKKAHLKFRTKVVDTKQEYIEALSNFDADVILSDHSLPQFNSTEAHAILKKSGAKIPFIIVTGNVSEEFAVSCIKGGVDDYILKSNLERLPSAIHNALQQKENERVSADALTELEANNKRLLKYNKEVEHFIFQVTSTLKKPMSSMLDLLRAMKESAADDSLQSYFSMMEDNIQKLHGTLNELQYANAKAQLNIEAVDIATLIEGHVEGLKFMPGAESIVTEVHLKIKDAVCSDRYQLSVIVNNLISNAIKYYDVKKNDPFIKISAAVTRRKIRLEFRDNGIGIDEQYLSKIFNMFFRATEKSEGVGLGLHIVKEAVDKLNGKISVSSRLEQGTVFIIELPNHRPDGQAENCRSNEKQFSKNRPAISTPHTPFNP